MFPIQFMDRGSLSGKYKRDHNVHLSGPVVSLIWTVGHVAGLPTSPKS